MQEEHYEEHEEYTMEDSEEMEEINFDTTVDTKLENIKNMFAAAELKIGTYNKHYIVRDSMDEFYYLKVNIYDNRPEFEYCYKYFLDLMTFTQQLAQTKKDVLRILNVNLIRSKNMNLKIILKLLLFQIMENQIVLILKKLKNYILFVF